MKKKLIADFASGFIVAFLLAISYGLLNLEGKSLGTAILILIPIGLVLGLISIPIRRRLTKSSVGQDPLRS